MGKFVGDFHENDIEFLTGDEYATGTFTSVRHINLMKKLSVNPEVTILAENEDGSICVKFPVAWIKFRKPRDLTKEEKERLAEKARENFQRG